MKINYFFPVFLGDKIDTCLKNFKSSTFFKKYSNYNFIYVCDIADVENKKVLETEVKKNKKDKLILLDKCFTYNDAFYNAISYFDGDVLLLGDTKINRIDLVFEKCMQKYEKNINVVHVIKKQTKFKGFILNTLKAIYNFFINIFTGKKDRMNLVSLGLIDKSILELLKVLPNKCCFLKNTKDLLGFETRTIYIPQDTKTYKLNYKKKTGALLSFIISSIVMFSLIITLILLNIFIKQDILVYNLLGILFIAFCISISVTTLPKHFFDIRNYENKQDPPKLYIEN